MPRAVHTLNAQNKENNPTFRSKMHFKPDNASSHHSSGAPASTTSSSGTFTAARTPSRFAAEQNKLRMNLSYKDAVEQKQDKVPTRNFYGSQKKFPNQLHVDHKPKKKDKAAANLTKKGLINKINMISKTNPPGLGGYHDDNLEFHTGHGHTPSRSLYESSLESSTHPKKFVENRDFNHKNSTCLNQSVVNRDLNLSNSTVLKKSSAEAPTSQIVANSNHDTPASPSSNVNSAAASLSDGKLQLKSYEIGFKVC